MLGRFSFLSRSSTAPSSVPDETAVLTELRRKLSSDSLFELEDIRTWADDACLLRYLRANNGNPELAEGSLRRSAMWRVEQDISTWLPASASPQWSVISEEAATGKMFLLPKPNRHGQAIIVMRPGLENNTTEPAKNLLYLTYTLERAAALTTDGTFVIIIDYSPGDFSLARAPSLKTSKEVLSVLQSHYPERLHKAFMLNTPPYFLPLFRLIKPFIDPVTASKSKSPACYCLCRLLVICGLGHFITSGPWE